MGGTMLYKSDTFHALADEYGPLVWQDFALANFDYANDATFSTSIEREAAQLLVSTHRFTRRAVRQQRGGTASRNVRTAIFDAHATGSYRAASVHRRARTVRCTVGLPLDFNECVAVFD
ncbi:MAG TPA: hypothetical protein VF573_10225 [Paraburkholderia sp.]|uniref:hypothetical protein n=1 Tax=Paraburkholderia sp. TaxID=1926495 RepID=UPI002ED0B748